MPPVQQEKPARALKASKVCSQHWCSGRYLFFNFYQYKKSRLHSHNFRQITLGEGTFKWGEGSSSGPSHTPPCDRPALSWNQARGQKMDAQEGQSVCQRSPFKARVNNEHGKPVLYLRAWFCLRRNKWSCNHRSPHVSGSTSCPIRQERHQN